MSPPEAHLETIRMLIESSGAIVPRTGDLKRIRALRFTDLGFDVDVWRRMCDFGWLALRVPEERGGAGLGARAQTALMTELGRGLVPEPLVSSGITAALIGDEHLQAIFDGKVILPAWQDTANSFDAGHQPLQSGRLNVTKKFVHYANGANAFLVVGDSGIAVVERDAPGVTLTTDQTQDGGHFGTLCLHDVEVTAASVPPERVEAALDEAALATAAYLVGVAERAFEMTIEYLKTRHQFGRPIGSFQSLQHRAVDLKLQLALARASVESAATAIDGGATSDARLTAVSRAKIRASQTALLVTRQGVQMHGAIGYTDEYDLGLFLRKAMVLAHLYGAPALHKKRVTESLMARLH